MAGRTLALRAGRGLLQTLRPSAAFSSLARSHQATATLNPGINIASPGILTSTQPSCFSRICQRQWMSSDIAQMPRISDPDVLKTLHQLLAVSWLHIPDETEDAVKAAISKKSDDVAGQEVLANAWRSADAVEKFAGTLTALRMELDDASGVSGEKVRPLSKVLQDALAAAFSRYNNYLAAFGDDETYLKKKVEIELGSLMVHIRQRCSGLGPQWGKVTVLGTSGLSGSYIEHRAE